MEQKSHLNLFTRQMINSYVDFTEFEEGKKIFF